MELYYFAYGSNMDASRIEARLDWLPPRRLAWLDGYEFCFHKIASRNPEREGFANIVPQPGSVVWGVLYQVSPQDIEALDQYEGYPEHYVRETVEVAMDGNGTVDAITYIARPEMTREGLLPSKAYLEHLLQACVPLPEAYRMRLRATPTLD